MKATDLFVTFYNQIGKAYLINRPTFISALFNAAGSTHETAEIKRSYGDSDYRYKLCNGTKSISIEIKRSFPNNTIDVEKLADYFIECINKNKDVHTSALMTSFEVKQSLEQDTACLAMALALQFKAFIDDKENDDISNIIPTEYERLLSEKSKIAFKEESAYEQDEHTERIEPPKQTLNQINITQNIATIQSGGQNIGFVGKLVQK